jgi:hypothetical protein
MKIVGTLLLALLIAFLGLAIGGGIFALLAYAVGLVITRVTGLETLPATTLSLVAMFLFGILLERAFNSVTSIPRDLSETDEFDDDYDEDEDDFDMDEAAELSDQEMDALFPGIPRWRRPPKALDFSNAKPDDRCPCGSGRKFKNCHGRKTNSPKE